MEERQLLMDHKIGIKLSSVHFLNGRDVVVEFALYAYGSTLGESHKILTTIGQETPRHMLENSDLPDYHRIVGNAAAKLKIDFQDWSRRLSVLASCRLA